MPERDALFAIKSFGDFGGLSSWLDYFLQSPPSKRLSRLHFAQKSLLYNSKITLVEAETK
jgi:hypothetical protein